MKYIKFIQSLLYNQFVYTNRNYYMDSV